jgi:hypothetical protein
MLTLNVQVPEARDRAAFATLRDGFKTVMNGNAVASATPTIAASNANPSCDPMRLWGHPPFGSYRLLNHRPASHDQAREYGSHLLVFEPESGQALEAESFGRLALLVYAGPADRDRKLRRTQGGVRLTDRMLDAIVSRLRSAEDMVLELEPLRAPSWWQFWKQPVVTQPLSGSLLTALQPSADELSLLTELMQKSVRHVRRHARDDRDDRFDRDRRDDRSGSGPDSGREPFQGKGGEYAGGGASGGWADAPGRAPGVDQAGRIIGAAAAAGALAAMASGAARASSRPADGAGADSGDAGSGPGASTTTSTAY